MTEVHLDCETRSPVPIRHGVFRYANECELLLLAWAVGDGPVELWDAANEPIVPQELWHLLKDQSVTLIAHNAAFEQAVLAKTLPQFDITPRRWRCSMVRALAHGLPGALGTLAQVLNLPEQKLAEDGKKLIRLFCIPPGSRLKRKTYATRETHPAEWEQFREYCRQDVRTEAAAWHAMPGWNYPGNASELDLWHLDQQINQRGFCVDEMLCTAAIKAIFKAQEDLGEQAHQLTDGDIASATMRGALFEYLKPLLAEEGLALENMQAATLEKLLDNDQLPGWLRDLLTVRLQASTSSTAKYRRALEAVSADSRLRGSLQFAGASRTGRWAGRGLQVQNLPRPTMSREAIDDAIEHLKLGTADLVYG